MTQMRRNSASLGLVISTVSSERGKCCLSYSPGRSNENSFITKKRSLFFFLDSWRLNGNLIHGMEFSFIVSAECKKVGHYQLKQQTGLCLHWHVSMTNVKKEKKASVVCYHPRLFNWGMGGRGAWRPQLSNCPLWPSSFSQHFLQEEERNRRRAQKRTSIGMTEELEH